MPTHGTPELDEDARKLEALGAADPASTIEAFDAYVAEIVYEHRVGLIIHPHEPDPLWLSWDETLALHAWLSEMLKGKPK